MAVLGGLLLLAILTYGMYKVSKRDPTDFNWSLTNDLHFQAGFFKRTTKDELEKLQAEPAEAENLNSGTSN